MSLLKVLLCTQQRRASKAWLAAALWPESEERAARTSLNVAIRLLRHVVGTVEGMPLLRETADGAGIILAEQALVWVDLDAFEQAVTQATRWERQGREADAKEAWQSAYRLGSAGTFLPDELYEEWAQAPRHRYELLFPRCVRRVAEVALADDQPDEAETVLRAYWSTHLTDEEALCLLMHALQAQGFSQEALHCYQTSCKALDEELGIEPAAAT